MLWGGSLLGRVTFWDGHFLGRSGHCSQVTRLGNCSGYKINIKYVFILLNASVHVLSLPLATVDACFSWINGGGLAWKGRRRAQG